MHKYLYCFLISILLINYSFSQGSGFAMIYNGTSNFTQIPDNAAFSSHFGGQITVEAWVKVNAVNTDGHGQLRQPIVMKGNTGSWEWSLYIYDNLNVGFSTWQCAGSGHLELTGGAIVLGQWNHVSASYSDNNFSRVYLNGILVAQGTVFNGLACDGARPVTIGHREDGQFLSAEIDEIRIWNRALTHLEIQTNMCKKLTGSEPNLTAYYRFDEGVDNTCNATDDLCDLGPNGFNGFNVNAPVWSVSGAAIGDFSTFQYPFTTNVSLSTVNKGVMTIDNPGGTIGGMQLYRVASIPNNTVGMTQGLGSNNTYFGTFIAGGVAPTYRATFDYTNYPDANALEPSIILYSRLNNEAPSWANSGATLNTVANTFVINNRPNRGEFIIVGSTGALPVELVQFDLIPLEDRKVLCSWQTASELNNDYFKILKSTDLFNWIPVASVSSKGNSVIFQNYSFEDLNEINELTYYKLIQVDLDGMESELGIKGITNTSSDVLQLFPNPATGYFYISNSTNFNELPQIYDLFGKEMSSQVGYVNLTDKIIKIEVENLPAGTYLVKIDDQIKRFVKK